MFSPAPPLPRNLLVDRLLFAHTACGRDSSMRPERFETYPLSTAPTTTTTV